MNSSRIKYDLSHLIPGKLYKTVEEEYCDFFLWKQGKDGINVPLGGIMLLVKFVKINREGYIKSYWLYKEHYGFSAFHIESERARQLSCYKLMS